MKNDISPKRAAISLGILFGIGHAAWVILFTAWPGMLGMTYGMHFMSGVSIAPFAASMAVGGIVLAVICGAVAGWLFAIIWNWAGKFK